MGYVQPVDGLKLADFYNGAPKLSEAKKLSRIGIRSFEIFNVRIGPEFESEVRG